MMKSMFLSESKILDMDLKCHHHNNSTNTLSSTDKEEYVLVDTFSPCFEDDNNEVDEDDDYDYCEDALSEGMQSASIHLMMLTEDLILDEAATDPLSIILDDAHASASQLVISFKNDDASIMNHLDEGDDDDDVCHENEAHDVPGILESSASDNSVFSVPAPTQDDDPLAKENDMAANSEGEQESDEQETSSTTRTLTNTANATMQAQAANTLFVISSYHTAEPIPESESTPQVGGRMSNKKRRKKMKQMKKAAAAAKAVVALTVTSAPSPSVATNAAACTYANPSADSKHSLKANISPTSRYTKKRVANIAVVCATETLASYKAQLSALSKKVD
jgi:hypothetical protein